jgi:hypothetical protein
MWQNCFLILKKTFGLFFQNIHVMNGLWNIMGYSFQIFTFVQNCTPKKRKAKHDLLYVFFWVKVFAQI